MAKGQSKGAKGGHERPSGRRAARRRRLGGWLTRRRRRRLVIGAAVLAVALAAGGAWWLYADRLGAGARRVRSEPRQRPHPTAGDAARPYNSDPPTSGPHLAYIAPWGIHTKPITKELQTHNLEDGGVVVQYKPECEAQVLEPLKSVVGRYRDHVLLAPYPGLDRCIALTAWTRIDKLDQFDERRVVRFIDAYRGIDHHPR